jgi:sugar phosphate isomerase/epimerase
LVLRGNAALVTAGRVQQASPLNAIGLQLYTVRSVIAQDVEGTLTALARIGYKEVEFAGLYGNTAAQMRQILDRVGLRAVSSHHGMRDIRGEWQRQLDAANTLGQQYVIVASIDRAERSADAYRRIAEEFNKAGEAAKAAGLKFGYHNHDYEFADLGGTTGYDVLLAQTDPSLVVMELDLFWAVQGSRDPLSLFAAHPGRFHLVHVKDRTASGEMVNVGSGVIDFRTIFARSDQAGIRHAFVEHDNPTSPLDDVRASFEHLRGQRQL